VAPTTGTGQQYAHALGELWPSVQRALGRLDTIAGEPDEFDADDIVDELTRLQYHLHLGSEHVYGLEPPAGAESAHAELADALACARDATSEVAEAVADSGRDALRPLLHEWRGALFRVRLARLRLSAPMPRPAQQHEPPSDGIARPLLAFLLAFSGAVAVAGGATLGMWPVWTAGFVAVCGAIVTYRP